MDKFSFINTCINGVYEIQRKPIVDNRGYFERLFCINDFSEILSTKKVMQINHSFTENNGVVRGLHYQIPPFSETKIVTCLSGSVFDIIIDLRKGSPTFLKQYSLILSSEKKNMILIPEGFAHGFQTLSINSELIYFHTQIFNPQSERGIHALDPLLSIEWPLLITSQSAKDSNYTMLDLNFQGINI